MASNNNPGLDLERSELQRKAWRKNRTRRLMRRCWLILRTGKQEREDDINNEMLELRLITMTQKLSTYFPSRVCNVQADKYQMRPPRPQPIAMWLPERLLPRRAQCELAIQASVGAYHISDEWSFGWHAMKIFVVLKVMERRLLLGHKSRKFPVAKPAERKLLVCQQMLAPK